MKISGSYMKNGDQILYWKYKDGPYPVHNVTTALPNDLHVNVKLAAIPADDQIIAVNHKMYKFILKKNCLNNWQPFVFLPTVLAAGIQNYKIIDAQMSGGRTFLLSKESADELKLPYRIYLNLDKIGWGSGLLELRPEIKGAGTIFERTKLYKSKFRQILRNNLEMDRLFKLGTSNSSQSLILSSLTNFLGRNMGGQSVKLAEHSVLASSNLIDKSPIKFVPTWLALRYSEAVMYNLKILNTALPKNISLFEGISANEIRFTPSTVRALYFDNAVTDEELIILISRVSEQFSELEETLNNMVEDSRKYLELIVDTSQIVDGNKIAWIKIGDIHEKFVKNSNGQYKEANEYRKQRFAWVLAKDEVIVRKIGKFYTDMESYYGKDIGYTSSNIDELFFHHELYILNVLRDHIRICTKFAIASKLLKEKHISTFERKHICQKVVGKIVDTINNNPFLNIKLNKDELKIRVKYKKLCIEHIYRIPRDEIAEPY